MLSYDMHTWMPENLMMKADKMLMAHSLEGRFPFHDLELFEFAASLPEEYKLSKEGVGKWILKEALKDKLPMDVLLRPKMGFSVPVEQMLEVLKDRVLASFSPNRCPELAEIVDVAKLRKEVEGYYAGSGRLPIQIWTWFILFTWVELVGSERYLDLALPSRRQAEASP